MVHVSDAGGRHKMLAFTTEPNINAINVKEDGSLGSNLNAISDPAPTVTTTVTNNIVVTRVVKGNNFINSTNLSIIAEEPQVAMSNLLNANNAIDDSDNGNLTITFEPEEMIKDSPSTSSAHNSDNDDEKQPFLQRESDNTSSPVTTGNNVNNKLASQKKNQSGKGTQASPNGLKSKQNLNGTISKRSPADEDMEISSPSVPSPTEKTALLEDSNNSNDKQSFESNLSSQASLKPGKLTNGTKNAGLKRVSFGSSKGSMVETLIYESPVSEDPAIIRAGNDSQLSNGSIIKPNHHSTDPNDSIDSNASRGSTGGSRPPSRVRVTFFESEKPLAVSSPESDILDFDLSNMTLPGSPNAMDRTPPAYNRQLSAEMGWDNPFRPDGDLSKEADQIVELIKEGKPINDETLRSKSPSVNETMNSVSYTNALNASPKGKGANGSAQNGAGGSGSVEVQRGVVAPAGGAGQVEHVVLKKKKGCCVIQ